MRITTQAPEYLHVTFKEYSQAWPGTEFDEEPFGNGPVLGSVNVYAPEEKAYQKRLATQMKWAYDLYDTGYTVKEDGVYINEHTISRGGSDHVVPTQRISTRLQPRLLKNEPLEGYRLAYTYDFGMQSKRWWLADPRGFEFPITVRNMQGLLMTCTIERSVIHGKLMWKWDELELVS
jgi:hypothetical protein